MAKNKGPKYYVIWKGHLPGIYLTWGEAQSQIVAYKDAKFKSFPTRESAEKAFADGWQKHWAKGDKNSTTAISSAAAKSRSAIIWDSISVDAACAGVPGPMEYRGVITKTKEQIFHQGPFPDGTNNIGEFLAIVHGLALLQKKGKTLLPIYTDSKTAMAWVRNKKAKTTMGLTARNGPLLEMVARAEEWLKNNKFSNPIIKWETASWGEIPADFGRK